MIRIGFWFGTKSREGRNRDGGEERTINVSSLSFLRLLHSDDLHTLHRMVLTTQ